jgi:hypothetical protein
LATLLTKARDARLIKGLVPNLVEGGLTHLHYVDDTIIFLEADNDSIIHTKFLLYCLESMSGLKINYQKSEVMVVGASKEERSKIANILNCRKRTLPINYMGIPISDSKLFAANMIYVGLKVKERLPTWQGLLLSPGGKSILTKSSLSSLPNYTMGVYLLPKEVHYKMDSARAIFFLLGFGA